MVFLFDFAFLLNNLFICKSMSKNHKFIKVIIYERHVILVNEVKYDRERC